MSSFNFLFFSFASVSFIYFVSLRSQTGWNFEDSLQNANIKTLVKYY